MAAKKLSYDQIAEKGLFKPLIDEIKEVDKALKAMSEELKNTIAANAELAKQQPLKGYKDIEKTEKSINETEKAVADLNKVEKERARLQERLANLETDQAKRNAEIKVAIQERTRAMKEEATLNSEATSEYQKLSTRLTKLRKEYKDLAVTNKENTEEGKALLENIQAIDKRLKDVDASVGQYQRSVGNYEKAVNGLRGAFSKLAAATGVVKLLELIGNAFQTNQGSADALAKAFGRITVTIGVFINRIAQGFPIVGDIITSIQLKVERFGLAIKKALADAGEWFGGSEEKAEQLEKRISALDKQAGDLKGFSDLGNVFDGMGEEITDLIDANDKLIDQTTAYRKRAVQLRKELGDLLSTQAELEVAANNDTLSLQKQEEAALSLLEVNEEIAQKNVEIARNEEARAAAAARVRVGDLAAQEEYAQAYTEARQAEADADRAAAEVTQLRRTIQRNQLEQDLDILLDISDRRKTINEQIAADERESMQDRAAAIDAARADIDRAYAEIEDRINAFVPEPIDLQSLLDIEDTKELNEAINALDIDEVTKNAIRGVLIERAQATQDLNVAQADLVDTTNEYQTTSEDVAAQEELLLAIQEGRIDATDVLDKLEKKRVANQIERLQREIELTEEGSERRIELRQELNDLLLQQAKEQADKEAEIEANKQAKLEKIDEEARKKRLKRAQETFDVLGDVVSSYYDKQLEALDEQVEASKEREDQLREAAAQGIQDARENIAIEQQQQAEAERQRLQAIQRQKLAELALTALEVYASKVSAGEENALTSTITDISLLRGFIESLPPFYQGAERVGDQLAPIMPGRDGHVVRVDGDERILSPSQNAIIPRNMSNLELAQLAATANKAKSAEAAMDLSELAQGLQRVERAIQNQPVYQGMDFDRQKEALTFVVEKRGKRMRKHKKIGGVFGK